VERGSYPTLTSRAPAQMFSSTSSGPAALPPDCTDKEHSNSGLRHLVQDVVEVFRHVPLQSKRMPWPETGSHEPGDRTSTVEPLKGPHSHISHIPPGPGDSDLDSSLSASNPRPSSPSSLVANVLGSWPLGGDSLYFESAPALSGRSRDDLSIRYTLDGVPLYRENAPSLRDYDHAREASFSASLSTYSESILGIDLDLLQHQQLAMDTESYLATPTALEEHSFSCSPGDHEGNLLPTVEPMTFTWEVLPTTIPSRSITSSVFPVLLPVAAASGVVQHNHLGPEVSFHSPSGNIIQPQEADWECHLSMCLPENNSFRPIFQPPSEVQQAPSKAPLPAYLKRTPDSTHEYGTSPMTMSKSTVIGCHGVYRKESPVQGVEIKQPISRSASLPPPTGKRRRERTRTKLFTGAQSSSTSNKTAYISSKEVTFSSWVRWTLGICCPIHYGSMGAVGGCMSGDKFNTTHSK
jgi:hypothetical protein